MPHLFITTLSRPVSRFCVFWSFHAYHLSLLISRASHRRFCAPAAAHPHRRPLPNHASYRFVHVFLPAFRMLPGPAIVDSLTSRSCPDRGPSLARSLFSAGFPMHSIHVSIYICGGTRVCGIARFLFSGPPNGVQFLVRFLVLFLCPPTVGGHGLWPTFRARNWRQKWGRLLVRCVEGLAVSHHWVCSRRACRPSPRFLWLHARGVNIFASGPSS